MTKQRKGCPPDCPDRSAEPNCHTTCERYQELVAERARHKKPTSDNEVNGYWVDMNERIRRRRGKTRK